MAGLIRFSANLGFLWTELALPDAVRKAGAAGFSAVECHWPYDGDAAELRRALQETGLPMLGLNTRKGRPGEFGLAALPGREAEARAAIAEAFAYGGEIGAHAVHVMAGASQGLDGAAQAFRDNLLFACALAARHGMTVLIEPLNRRDAPAYFLATIEEAAALVMELRRPELKIMFDCYHQQITGGDLTRRFLAHQAMIGHVQIAAVPSRAEPDEGEVSYARLLRAIDIAGYRGFVGAEYKPRATTDEGLGWLATLRGSQR